MSDAPKVTGRVSTVRGASASGTKLVAFLLTASQGDLWAPVLVGTSTAVHDTFGDGEGPEELALYIEQTGLPALAMRVATSVAGAVSHIDRTRVTGASVFSVTGAALDRFEGVVEVLKGGTVGDAADDVTIRYSLDNRATWQVVKLGASTSYLMPATGCTLAFTAAELNTGDYAYFWTTPPAPDANGIAAAFEVLRGQKSLVRRVFPAFTLTGTLGAEFQTQINNYFSLADRDSQVLYASRDWMPPAIMQGSAVSVTFAAAGRTATRATGSWIADGFKVGMTVETTSPLNTGVRKVQAVTATVLTFTVGGTAVVDEGPITTSTHVGAESLTDWAAAITSEHAAVTGYRLDISGGMLQAPASPLTRRRPRRPVALAFLIRESQFDIHVSPAKVSNGPLNGWSMTSGQSVVEYDERVNQVLLASNFIVATTIDGEEGAFICLPRTRHPEDIDAFSRSMHVAVVNKANQVARKALRQQLSRDVELDGSGLLTPDEADAINSYCDHQLKIALLTKGPDGPNASDCQFFIDNTTDLRAQGAEVPFTVNIDLKGYLEKIRFTTSVSLPSQA